MPSLNELSPVQRLIMVRIVPWFIVFAGASSIYLGLFTIQQARQSTDWPTVKGKVVESGIKSVSTTSSSSAGSRVSYHANIIYEYDVIGKIYSGNRVSFGEYGREDEVHATEISDKYPEGETVDVFYDPDQPSTSVLEPGSHGVPWFFLALGFPFLLFGGGLLYFVPGKAAKSN